MDINETRKLLIGAIEDVQEMAGDEPQKITLETKPMCDLIGFDSLKGLSAITVLEEKLGEDLSSINNLFFIDGKNVNLSVKNIASLLHEHLEAKEGKKSGKRK